MIPRTFAVIVGIIFVIAGLGKAMDVTTAADSLLRFGFTRPIAELLIGTVALGEILLGQALVFGVWYRRSLAIAISVLAVFSIYLALILTLNDPPSCGGVKLLQGYFSARTEAQLGLVRNALMIAALVYALRRSTHRPRQVAEPAAFA